MAATRVDAHTFALALVDEPEAVMLDLIGSLPPSWHDAADGRQAGLDETASFFPGRAPFPILRHC
jgi:hypothetical protein